MSSIVRQKVGNKIYLYESVSFRNAEGKPRNHRKPIGKIDPTTGKPIYKKEYLERMAEQGTPIEVQSSEPIFSIEDVRHSSIKNYGAFYLFQHIAEHIGLLASLKEVVFSNWQELFVLTCYLISSGDPFLYCESWVKDTECLSVGSLSSQRISEMLTKLTCLEREQFYQAWCRCRSEQEYLALDITSISSYSKLIDDVEWGYNRDNESLPQINLCMLMGQQSKLPIYQTSYSGSLKDVSTLKTTLAKMDAVSHGKPLFLVMDKGFYSNRNINSLLNSSLLRFIIAVPFTANMAKANVSSERKDIDSIQNTIVLGSDSLRAVTKVRSWDKDHKVFIHVYYNALKAIKIKEELYAKVAMLKEQAIKDPASAMTQKDCKQYLLIRNSNKTTSGYTINIRSDVLDTELRHAGWMVLLSNHIADAREALQIYRDKDVVEKGILRLKNSLDLGRLRVHEDNRMQNKLFVGFLALILMSQIHKVMLDQGLYQNMTMKKMLMTLSKLRVQEIEGTRILYPLTKEQKLIYKAFDVDEPV